MTKGVHFLMNFSILIQKLTKIEDLRSLTLNHGFDEIAKFEILNPKIQGCLSNNLSTGFRLERLATYFIMAHHEWHYGSFMTSLYVFRAGQRVLRIFFKILVMRANFGDFGDFDIDFKILKKSCDGCYPILGQILEKFDFRILSKSQSYDKPPWRNFVFLSNFVEIEIFGF